jgi:N-methylhydantoinase A/oxoprolinase/acetone carboxylase beta subunit
MKVCIGVDVGGTNTDSAALYARKVVAKSKKKTTSSITLGVGNALRSVLKQLPGNFKVTEHL